MFYDTIAHLKGLGRIALAGDRVLVLMLGFVERLRSLMFVLDRFVQRVLGLIRGLQYRQPHCREDTGEENTP